MLIIAGKVYVPTEQRAPYLEQFEAFIHDTRSEPGCLDLVITADPIEPGRINIFELWESKDQLDTFRAKAEPPETGIEITGDEVTLYEISATRPPLP
jgi:quinol monooxygenase YgiN